MKLACGLDTAEPMLSFIRWTQCGTCDAVVDQDEIYDYCGEHFCSPDCKEEWKKTYLPKG